jgi:hypothetical protein
MSCCAFRSPATQSMKAALDYARLGWSVIPIEPRGKRPLVRWQVYQHRHPDATEVAEWFRRWSDANIAVVTGVVSGLVVLDLDPPHGGDASLQELERKHGPIVETVEARTGGGGRHLYFAHPGEMLHNRVGLAPGVDLRGDGGYVVAPPSVHASGEPYRWERSPDVCHLAPLPDWLSEASEEQGRRGHRSPSGGACCGKASLRVSATAASPPWPVTCCGTASILRSQRRFCSHGMRPAADLRWSRRRSYGPSRPLPVSISRERTVLPDAERCFIQTDLSDSSRRQQLRLEHPGQHPLTLRGRQPPEVGEVTHDQGIDGPEGDRWGDLLEGILRTETGVFLGRSHCGPRAPIRPWKPAERNPRQPD